MGLPSFVGRDREPSQIVAGLLGVVLAVGVLASGEALAAPGPNLLQNPGAEVGGASVDATTVTPPPSWVTTPKFTQVAYGTPNFPDAADSTAIGGEANLFAGGPDAGVSTAKQSVDVSGDAVLIDANRAQAVLGAHLGGFESQSDDATVTAMFLDGSNNSLGTMSIGPVTAADRGGETKLLFRTAQAAVPVNTRSIEVTMTATRFDGIYNDGYLDNVSLALDLALLEVNSTVDPGTGTCDDTECTLREAITAANSTSGLDFIVFDLPAGASIVPGSALPPITEAVSIDGRIAGAPGIELNGSLAGSGAKGLEIRAGGVTVRGLVINRFSGAGIALVNTGGGAALSGPTIQACYIGTDLTGQLPRGNGAGIEIGFFTGAVIGGAGAGQSNVISANSGAGIVSGDATGSGSDHQIVANRIGTNVAGTTDLGNGVGVFLIGSPGNLISGNVISGNTAEGVAIALAGATQNLVYGNRIGVGADGTTPIGNGNHGVAIGAFAGNNRIGGVVSGEGNVIAYNVGDGVSIAAPNNLTMGNAIFSNGQLGIDLADGTGGEVTPNDPGDADGGGSFNSNHLQNFPVLTSATVAGSATTVAGTINSTPSFFFDIELFGSPACDPSGHGEGRTFLGRAFVIADAGGNAAFTTTLPAVTPGTSITATATDPNADTSEFSACRQVTSSGGPGTAPGGGSGLSAKQVSLEAKPKEVGRGDKTRLVAKVTPCTGHEGDLIEFYRGKNKIASKASNQSCVARHKRQVNQRSTFHAVSPVQDSDHLAGTSAKVIVKIKGP